MTAADTAVVRGYFSFERTRDLRAAGVRLLAGTDAPLAYVYPGLSLHEELELLVPAGSTPMEAIQAATASAAAFLGGADSLGTVRKGNVADLEFLDADPLVDIRNTRRINAVIANGRLLRRDGLDSILRSVERARPR